MSRTIRRREDLKIKENTRTHLTREREKVSESTQHKAVPGSHKYKNKLHRLTKSYNGYQAEIPFEGLTRRTTATTSEETTKDTHQEEYEFSKLDEKNRS